MEDAAVNTRFRVLSDTHDLDLKKSASCIPAVDVVIHCGDITEGGGIEQHRNAIDGLASIRGELKLVIAGNHDIDLDPAHGEASQSIEAMWLSAKDHNIHYLKEGTYTFVLTNGASFTVHASPQTPEYGVGSGFQYPTNEDRYNLSSPEHAKNVCTKDTWIPENIDILMTHRPPKYILDQCADRFRSSGGCEHLRRAVRRAKPRLPCFGHIHQAWGAIRAQWGLPEGEKDNDNQENDEIDLLSPEFVGKNSSKKRGFARLSHAVYEQCRAGEQTLFINAALGNDNGRMENVPWIVDLDLKRAEG